MSCAHGIHAGTRVIHAHPVSRPPRTRAWVCPSDVCVTVFVRFVFVHTCVQLIAGGQTEQVAKAYRWQVPGRRTRSRTPRGVPVRGVFCRGCRAPNASGKRSRRRLCSSNVSVTLCVSVRLCVSVKSKRSIKLKAKSAQTKTHTDRTRYERTSLRLARNLKTHGHLLHFPLGARTA